MEKAYRYRIYPNKQQQELIQKTFGCVRFVYNYYLIFFSVNFSVYIFFFFLLLHILVFLNVYSACFFRVFSLLCLPIKVKNCAF